MSAPEEVKQQGVVGEDEERRDERGRELGEDSIKQETGVLRVE